MEITTYTNYMNNSKPLKLLFCGGGTAGHVTPNLALCDVIASMQHDDCWMSSFYLTAMRMLKILLPISIAI